MTILLEDSFSTAAAAPITPNTPRVCEGTGFLNISSSIAAIASGQLVFNGSAAANSGWISANNAGAVLQYTRAAGLMLSIKFPTRTTTGSNVIRTGWHTGNLSSTALSYGFDYTTTSSIRIRDGANVPDSFNVGTNTHQFFVVLQATGAYLFASDGGGAPFLMWVYESETGNVSAKMVVSALTSINVTMDDLLIRQLSGSSWTTQSGIAVLNQVSPANNTGYTAVADGIIDVTMPAPASVTTDCYIRFRITDANNYWRMGFNSARAFRVDRVTGGVVTNVVNVNTVITAGTSQRVRAVLEGNNLSFFTLSGSTWTKRGSTQVNSQGATSASIQTEFGNWVGSNLVAYARNSTTYNDLVQVSATLNPLLLEPSGQLFAPTLVPGDVSLNLALLPPSGELFTPALAAGGTQVNPALLEPSGQLYTPSLAAGEVSITSALLPPSGELFTPTLSAGGVSLTPNRLEPSGELYAPTLIAGGVTLTPARLEPSGVLYDLTFQPGGVSINPALLEPSGELFLATLTSATILNPARLEPSGELFAPSLVAGAVAINPDQLEPSGQLFTPSLLPGNTAIQPLLLEPSGELYAPSVVAGGVVLNPALLEPSGELFQPLLIPGAVSLLPSRLEPSGDLFSPTISADEAVLRPGRLEPSGQLFPVVLIPGSAILTPALLEPSGVLYRPTITDGDVTPGIVVYGVVTGAITSTTAIISAISDTTPTLENDVTTEAFVTASVATSVLVRGTASSPDFIENQTVNTLQNVSASVRGDSLNGQVQTVEIFNL